MQYAIIYSFITILEKTEVQSISPTETSKHTKVRNEITVFSTFLHIIRENFTNNDVSQNTKLDLQKILAWFIIDYFTHNLDLISQARKNFRPQNTNDDTVIVEQSDYVWDPEWSHPTFINIPQDISPINIFSFVTLKNEILAFLGWPYYILEKSTILYAMFNFIGFLFSLLKGIYNTCAIHTQVNRQASVAFILFAGFFGIFSSSINKILLDAQIKEYNTKISTRQNTYDEEHNNIEITPTAPQLPPLPQNHPLSLVPRNFRNLAITNNPNSRPKTIQYPIQHIMTHQLKNDNTYEQIIEQPHTTTFQPQNNHFFSPR